MTETSASAGHPALDYAERVETAWAAGLFEGEGCISLESRWKAFIMYIGMTDRDVVERFALWAGCGTVREHLTPAMKRNNRKTAWLWRIQGNKAERVFERLLPYLGERRTSRYEEIMQIVYGSEST